MSVIDRPFNRGKHTHPLIKLNYCRIGILPVGEKGFTLIELLVVIMIIGILSAIALPAFLSQVNKAKEAEATQATTYLRERQFDRFHQESNFTDNLNQLNNHPNRR